MEHLLNRFLPLTPLLYHSERLTECLDFMLLSHVFALCSEPRDGGVHRMCLPSLKRGWQCLFEAFR